MKACKNVHGIQYTPAHAADSTQSTIIIIILLLATSSSQEGPKSSLLYAAHSEAKEEECPAEIPFQIPTCVDIQRRSDRGCQTVAINESVTGIFEWLSVTVLRLTVGLISLGSVSDAGSEDGQVARFWQSSANAAAAATASTTSHQAVMDQTVAMSVQHMPDFDLTSDSAWPLQEEPDSGTTQQPRPCEDDHLSGVTPSSGPGRIAGDPQIASTSSDVPVHRQEDLSSASPLPLCLPHQQLQNASLASVPGVSMQVETDEALCLLCCEPMQVMISRALSNTLTRADPRSGGSRYDA